MGSIFEEFAIGRYNDDGYGNSERRSIRQSMVNLLVAACTSMFVATCAFAVLFGLALTIWAPVQTCPTASTTTVAPGSTTTTSPISQYITDLYFVAGVLTPMGCPPGYTQVAADFNLNSGGQYIFICVSYNATAYTPITGLQVYAGSSDMPTPAFGSQYTYIRNSNGQYYPGLNLNAEIWYSNFGLPETYVYMAMTRDPTVGPPLMKQLTLVNAPSCPPSVPSGWTAITTDLNSGGVGSCLYLIYQ